MILQYDVARISGRFYEHIRICYIKLWQSLIKLYYHVSEVSCGSLFDCMYLFF